MPSFQSDLLKGSYVPSGLGVGFCLKESSNMAQVMAGWSRRWTNEMETYLVCHGEGAEWKGKALD